MINFSKFSFIMTILIAGFALFSFSLAIEESEVSKRIENVKRATVLLEYHPGEEKVSNGSGFIIKERQLKNGDVLLKIFTAAHVVEKVIDSPQKLNVIMVSNLVGRVMHLSVIAIKINSGYDPHTKRFSGRDTAIVDVILPKSSLRYIPKGLPKPVELRDSPVEIGERVSVLGFPHGSGAKQERVRGEVMLKYMEIVTNIPVTEGMSGGPLIDSRGFVVGLLSAELISRKGGLFQPIFPALEFKFEEADISQSRKIKILEMRNEYEVRFLNQIGRYLKELPETSLKEIFRPKPVNKYYKP